MILYYVDGGCEGNGTSKPLAYGSWCRVEDGLVTECDQLFLLPEAKTNNQAEYMALLHLLQRGVEHDAEIRMDSQLVVRQLNGEYAVRNYELKPLFEEVRTMLHVPVGWVERSIIERYLGH